MSSVNQYEGLAFADVHRDVLHLFPATPSRVLDIGAGTGRDAAAFANPRPHRRGRRADARIAGARPTAAWQSGDRLDRRLALPDLDKVHRAAASASIS